MAEGAEEEDGVPKSNETQEEEAEDVNTEFWEVIRRVLSNGSRARRTDRDVEENEGASGMRRNE